MKNLNKKLSQYFHFLPILVIIIGWGVTYNFSWLQKRNETALINEQFYREVDRQVLLFNRQADYDLGLVRLMGMKPQQS